MKKGKGKRKTATRTAVRPRLIPQPGGGALLSGGMPGNRGGGLRSSAFLDGLRAALDDAQALEVVKRIISGDILEQIGSVKGEPVYGQTRNADRLKAIEFAANYVLGRPVQRMEHSGVEGGPIEYNLSGLSDRELATLERLVKKSQPDPTVGVVVVRPEAKTVQH